MIAVTGANGYLGERLCAAFAAGGAGVRRLVRNPDPARGDAGFALGSPLPPDTLAGVDTLVHAAHDFAPTSERQLKRINRDGTRMLYDAARAAGVRRIVFVSSLAAFARARSAYGRVKFAIEGDTTTAGGISIRPGTIYGAPSGGLFAALERAVSALPVLPDFGKKARLHLVHAADLVRVVQGLVDPALPIAPGVLAVAHPESLTLTEILRRMAAATGRTPLFVPIPPEIALLGLWKMEVLGMRPPFRSDSMKGLLHGNPAPGLAAEVLGVPLRAFTAETLRQS